MTLQVCNCSIPNFLTYMYEENLIFFFISAYYPSQAQIRLTDEQDEPGRAIPPTWSMGWESSNKYTSKYKYFSQLSTWIIQ
jgi:hypothetical protein